MKGLECRGIGLAYGRPGVDEQSILQDVFAHFPAGRIALISGATGAGKSSLLHILAALLRPTCGTVYADGQPVSRWTSSHRDLWRRKTGILFQHPHFFHDLTVIENAMLPLIPSGAAIDDLRRDALRALDQLEISHLARMALTALSGGQKQRLSMARALIAEPQYLFLDEPTAHQDDHGCELLFRHLRLAGKRRATVVITAHDVRVSRAGIADDRWLLIDGHLQKIA